MCCGGGGGSAGAWFLGLGVQLPPRKAVHAVRGIPTHSEVRSAVMTLELAFNNVIACLVKRYPERETVFFTRRC